jgi:hypothetical protein
MSFLFISHASADKRERILPLLRVLLAEQEMLWVDRPGMGEDSLGLEQAVIDRMRIAYLLSGRSWPGEIQAALRESGAVIGCLSRAALQNRPVLEHELAYATTAGKLVTCIVDDLRHEELSSRGFVNLESLQSPRIDCVRLAEALTERQRGRRVEDLRPDLLREWEQVRGLIAAANRLRSTPRPLLLDEIEPRAAVLLQVPIGPVVKPQEIPWGVVEAFAAGLDSPARIEDTLAQARTILSAAFPEGYTEKQIYVGRGELPPLGAPSPEAFWLQLFSLAGRKARRTLASFLVCPNGEWAMQRVRAEDCRYRFLKQLAMR